MLKAGLNITTSVQIWIRRWFGLRRSLRGVLRLGNNHLAGSTSYFLYLVFYLFLQNRLHEEILDGEGQARPDVALV